MWETLMQNVYYIYIENEKKNLAQKSRCPMASLSGPANFPLGAQRSKPNFSFFNSRKEKFTPQNDIILGRFQSKKITRASPASASWPARHGPRALHYIQFGPLVLLCLPFFGLQAYHCTCSEWKPKRRRVMLTTYEPGMIVRVRL